MSTVELSVDEYHGTHYPLHALDAMGLAILEPETDKELLFAESLEAFSTFVLEDERVKSLAILEDPMDQTVGGLTGGNDEYFIYRASITGDDKDNSAVSRLLTMFHARHPRYASLLTSNKLESYMLAMCEKGHLKCDMLGNFMLIIAFGPTNGQVRHIDHMDPNLMVCLFMSKACPATIVYEMEGPPVTSGKQLVEYWEDENLMVPSLIKDILLSHGDKPLQESMATKYFGFWSTINRNLWNFGKLYQRVARKLSLRDTEPGTTMIAGPVNQVHAGPPTSGPRMFAFAVGIPKNGNNEEEINGEIQYSAASLHLDLCCILFSIMDFDFEHRVQEHADAKSFLLHILVDLCEGLPQDYFHVILGDDRGPVRDWLEALLKQHHRFQDKGAMELIQEALGSKSIFHGPHIGKVRMKKQRKTKSRKK